MKIISFAWTTGALLDGRKTVTRRNWTDRYARQFHQGDLVQVYDRSPRVGGRRVATIRLTRDPYKERLEQMTDEEERAEGGLWGSAEAFVEAFCEGAGLTPIDEVWVIRFELVEVEV